MSDSNLPENFKNLIEKAIDDFDEVEESIEWSLREAKRLSGWKGLSSKLIRSGWAEHVYDARHQRNVSIKRANGEYGGPPKVRYQDSEGVSAEHTVSYFDSICYHGKRIGNMTRDELINARDDARAKADGYAKLASLFDWAAKRTKGGKTLRECVKDGTLVARCEEIWGTKKVPT